MTRYHLHRNAAILTVSRARGRRAAPVTTVRASRAVWAAAVRLAGGDRRRLDIQPDGSVVVRNRPKGETRALTR